jgi:hypothetical protein
MQLLRHIQKACHFADVQTHSNACHYAGVQPYCLEYTGTELPNQLQVQLILLMSLMLQMLQRQSGISNMQWHD